MRRFTKHQPANKKERRPLPATAPSVLRWVRDLAAAAAFWRRRA
jgi:hypothetical protein